jgi:hypothetical protein
VIQLTCTPVVGLGLEGGLGLRRNPSIRTDPGAASWRPLSESALDCLIETDRAQSSDIASGNNRLAIRIRYGVCVRWGPRSGALRGKNSICG